MTLDTKTILDPDDAGPLLGLLDGLARQIERGQQYQTIPEWQKVAALLRQCALDVADAFAGDEGDDEEVEDTEGRGQG